MNKSQDQNVERVHHTIIVGVGTVLAFVLMAAVYRTDSDAHRMKSCKTLFLLYLDVEEPSEKKKKRETPKAREMTEGTP